RYQASARRKRRPRQRRHVVCDGHGHREVSRPGTPGPLHQHPADRTSQVGCKLAARIYGTCQCNGYPASPGSTPLMRKTLTPGRTSFISRLPIAPAFPLTPSWIIPCENRDAGESEDSARMTLATQYCVYCSSLIWKTSIRMAARSREPRERISRTTGELAFQYCRSPM